MKIQFKLTEEHVKLIRRMNVGWQDAEAGAPEIDPKRPYGNGSHLNDIHEILTGEEIGMVDSKRDSLTEKEEERYTALHREMETALSVVLASGSFEPGVYEADKYKRDWRKAK